MKSTHKKYHRKLEWPDKTQKILPDLFLERQESKSQSLTDSKNDENVTANSKLYLQMFKEDFLKIACCIICWKPTCTENKLR